MTAYAFAHNQSFNCCAAAGSFSAQIIDRMDTVIELAVSIIVRRICVRLRIMKLA